MHLLTQSTAVLAESTTGVLDESIGLLTIFVLSVFVGFEVVSKVSTVLHTPLMSGANAIHGIVVVGAIQITAGTDAPLETVLGVLAVFLGAVNLVGGFAVTDRMLEMFKPKAKPAKDAVAGRSERSAA